MSNPGIGLSQMTVRFSDNWTKGYKETKRLIRWVVIKSKIKRFFGIYHSFSAEILSDPIQVEDGWEYDVKLKLVHSYFLWIKYKTEPYIADGKR